jgi:hypothetical protein
MERAGTDGTDGKDKTSNIELQWISKTYASTACSFEVSCKLQAKATWLPG